MDKVTPTAAEDTAHLVEVPTKSPDVSKSSELLSVVAARLETSDRRLDLPAADAREVLHLFLIRDLRSTFCTTTVGRAGCSTCYERLPTFSGSF